MKRKAPKLVRLLEQALEAAHEGAPQNSHPTIYSVLRRAQSKGLKTEAHILKLAWNIVISAMRKDDETHFEMLANLHDVVCDYLDDLSEPDPDVDVQAEAKASEPKIDIRRMN
jgi:hypothetical protein